jgi:hypothetical protein
MTEAEWLAATAPWAMLEFLEGTGRGPDRKLRLFAAACCRRIWRLVTDARSRRAVEAAEAYADARIDGRQLQSAAEAASAATAGPYDDSPHGQQGAHLHARMAAMWAAMDPISPEEVANRTFGATVCDPDDPEEEEAPQAGLLRDIFGNPFDRTPDLRPDWLRWNGGVVRTLAETAYQHRTMPAGRLKRQRLALLADALEDAGCSDAELLSHLRSPGPHVRGCWALDLVLGKE